MVLAGCPGTVGTGAAVDIMLGGCDAGMLVGVCGVVAVGVVGADIPGVAGVLVGVNCGVPG